MKAKGAGYNACPYCLTAELSGNAGQFVLYGHHKLREGQEAGGSKLKALVVFLPGVTEA